MTTVTSLTADRMLAIEAASVVDGDVVGDNLILTKHDGSQINAGSVRGPQGTPGPVGQDLPILTATPVLDVGLSGQIRAGRQLTAADFTNMGLSAPIGLWNLSDLSDVSGNGRNLLNKGAVPFDVGINGVASTAARFVGFNAQALYISDTGASDPFRIRAGSVGCWFKTSKAGATQPNQALLAKQIGTWTTANLAWMLYIGAVGSNYVVNSLISDGTTQFAISGMTNIGDDRWHFAVVTIDGTNLRIYVDGLLEGTASAPLAQAINAIFNIGSSSADGANLAANQFTGRIDEAFITADILSEDQVRNLYCAKIPHTLTTVPSRVSLNVHRRRKGAALVVADFPTQPLRLHNFSGGSLGDEGSNGVAQTLVGTPVSVSGVDGSAGNAYNFNGNQALGSTDTGLPAGLATRSYGCWMKSTSNITGNVILWGTLSTGDARLLLNSTGVISAWSGSDAINGSIVNDGLWHHLVVVEDNTAADGYKRKLYMDGKLVGESTVMNPIVLSGAFAFRIASNNQGTGTLTGQVDGAFVCGYALTSEQITRLYIKSLIALASSPKNVGDHVESMNVTDILATFDTLESQHTVDLMVAP